MKLFFKLPNWIEQHLYIGKGYSDLTSTEINILKENDILLELLAYKIASNKDILRKIKLNDNDNEKIKKRTEEVSLKIKCCEEMIANVTKRDKDQIR